VLYPLFIALAANMRGRKPLQSHGATPYVSIVLAVYNEELVLQQCLSSLLAIDYPRESFELLVGSDGSSDKTNEILRACASEYPQLRISLFPERRGKIPVVNDLVPLAHGEIILFTDADVTFAKDIIQVHLSNYADEYVGGVAGSFLLSGKREHGPLGAEQDYMSLEVRLRQNESDLHSTVGIFGGNYSLRRECWNPLPNLPICDELYSTLRIIRSGKRMVFDREALATEQFGRSMQDEYQRKKRFASRGFHTLKLFPDLLQPFAGLPALMLWSHKILRWLTPFFLIMLPAGTLSALLESRAMWIELLALLELGAVVSIALGWVAETTSFNLPFVRKAYWFFVMNLAFAFGTLNFLFSREQKFWSQPTRYAVEVGSPNTAASSKEVPAP
jgi:biofilm PGA synthesis N-glycosyltransferase PgaC